MLVVFYYFLFVLFTISWVTGVAFALTMLKVIGEDQEQSSDTHEDSLEG